MTVQNFKCTILRIVADGRERVPEDYPIDDGIRSFRARHREITYRKTENKEAVKIRGEIHEHVKTYEDVFRRVGKDFPGMLQAPNRFRNMDETPVDFEYGEREKSFTAFSSHYGAFNAIAKGGNGKHITAAMAVTASSLIDPPFFIVAGKIVMSRWFQPFHKNEIDFSGPELHALNEPRWFPGEGYAVCSENGSMKMNIMPLFIAHLDGFVRKVFLSSKEYIFALDGHASRKGVEWLYACLDKKCNAVQSPATLRPRCQFLIQHNRKENRGQASLVGLPWNYFC